MVYVNRSAEGFTVTLADGTLVELPYADAARLLGELIEQIGVSGVTYAQGVADGLQLGYQQRDREYVIDHAKRFRRAQRAALTAAAQKVEAA